MKTKSSKLKNYFIKDIQFCGGCCKQGDSHKECYDKFCIYCNIFFITLEEHKNHCLKYHREHWCQKCNQCFKVLKNHQEEQH